MNHGIPEVFAVWDPYQRAPRVDLYIQDNRRHHSAHTATRIHPLTHFPPYGHGRGTYVEGVIEEIHWNHNPEFFSFQVELDEHAPLKTVYACNTSLVVRTLPDNRNWNDALGDPIPLLILWAPPFTYHARPAERSLHIPEFYRWDPPLTQMWNTMQRRFHLPDHPHIALYDMFEQWNEERERREHRERRERRREARRERYENRYATDSDEDTHPIVVPSGAAGGAILPVAPVVVPPPAHVAATSQPPIKPAPAERIALALARDFVASKEVCPITQDPLKAGRIAVTACNCVFQADGLETWASSHTTCPSCRTDLAFRVVSVS